MRASSLWVKRPHLGHSPLKYSFEVLVLELELKPNVQCDRLSVLWTRGSKAAHTREVDVSSGKACVDEKLCLLCTLFRDDKRRTFDRKLCTFTIVQRSGIKLGRASIDLSQWAGVEPSINPTSVSVDVQRGGLSIGTLRLAISSRWLKEYQRQAGAAADDASSLCSASVDESVASDGDDAASAWDEGEDGAGEQDDGEPASQSDADSFATQAVTAETLFASRALAAETVGSGSGQGSGYVPSPSGSSGLSPQPPPLAIRAQPSIGTPLQLRRSSRLASGSGSGRPRSVSQLSAQAADGLLSELAHEKAARLALQLEVREQSSSLASLRADAGEAQALRELIAEMQASHALEQEHAHAKLVGAQREKELALSELRALAAERDDDRAALSSQLATVEVTFGERLARAEEQRQTISRRLGKSAKSAESALAQLTAERSMLEARADALENEVCELLELKRKQSNSVLQLTRRVGELDAQCKGVRPGQPLPARAAEAELRAQLALAQSVRESLQLEMARLEQQLVAAKLHTAQDEELKANLRRQLRASRARQLALAERMTELEVRLSDAFGEAAVAEERIAQAFSAVVRDLEQQLAVKAAAAR